MECVKPQLPLLQFCLFILNMRKFPSGSLKDIIIFHQQVKYILYSIFTFRTIPHLGFMKILYFFNTCFTHFISNTSLEVNLSFFYLLPIWEHSTCKRETCIYATAACLPVCPAVSLRRKTCVLLTERYCFSDGLLYVD